MKSLSRMEIPLASLLLALALAPFTLYTFWKSSKTFREFVWWLRNLVTGNSAGCEVIKFKGADSIPDGLLHSHNLCNCTEVSHNPGRLCFKNTLKTVFKPPGGWRVKTKDKPINLGGGFFIETDYDLILAFILCTIDEASFNPDMAERGPKDYFRNGNTFLEVDKNNDAGIIKVHLQGRIRRGLTKKEVARMLEGWPPFYQEIYNCRTGSPSTPFLAVDAVSQGRYIERGGWIIASALSNAKPVPVYIDKVSYANEVRKYVRAGVFWKSIDHVLWVIERNIQPLYPGDANITLAIDCISRARKTETWSEIEDCLHGTPLHRPPRRLLMNETDQAISVFNQIVELSSRERQTLKRNVDPMLVPLLYAAVKGVRMCVDYVKNAGRELDPLLPTDLDRNCALYVGGCL